MEQKLIDTAKKYIEMEICPESESICNELFDIAEQIKQPRTKSGQAIVAWVNAEIETDFSLSANDEFEEMCRVVKSN